MEKRQPKQRNRRKSRDSSQRQSESDTLAHTDTTMPTTALLAEAMNDTSEHDHDNLDDSTSGHTTCDLCFDRLDIMCVGSCNHGLCHVCGLRMRALCNDQKCPICRKELKKVLLTRTLRVDYNAISKKGLKWEKKWNGYCESPSVFTDCMSLFDAPCPECHEEQGSFSRLRGHVKREHQMHYCDLCANNTHLFPWEQNLYTRSQVVQHRKGNCTDIDPPSFKGHPICGFCQTRFYDNDALHKHLRERHERCYLCNKQDEHFENYNDLEKHFKEDHFLCNDRECLRKKFVVFKTEIELKNHRIQEHGSTESRRIPGFDLSYQRTFDRQRQQIHRRHQHEVRAEQEAQDAELAQALNQEEQTDMNQYEAPPTLGHEDFPSLGGNNSSAVPSSNQRYASIPQQQQLAQDDFPALPASSRPKPSLKSRYAAPVPQQQLAQDNFPALSAPSKPKASSSSTSKFSSAVGGQRKHHVQPPKKQSSKPVNITEDESSWPSLSGNSSSSGTSSRWVTTVQGTDSRPQVDYKKYEFVAPENLKQRNKTLLRSIKSVLNDQEMESFKLASGSFRKNELSAQDYFGVCQSTLGDNMQKLFPELVALLPDLKLQHDLVAAEREFSASRQVRALNISTQSRQPQVTVERNQNAIVPLEWNLCPHCQQVLPTLDDERYHAESHDPMSEAQFPSLPQTRQRPRGSGKKNSTPKYNAWSRK